MYYFYFEPVRIIVLISAYARVTVLAGLGDQTERDRIKRRLRIIRTAFQGRFTYGALITFLVTAADIPIFGIGAPFWALVFGFLTSYALERGDFMKGEG